MFYLLWFLVAPFLVTLNFFFDVFDQKVWLICFGDFQRQKFAQTVKKNIFVYFYLLSQLKQKKIRFWLKNNVNETLRLSFIGNF
jgi:hypothetical protein